MSNIIVDENGYTECKKCGKMCHMKSGALTKHIRNEHGMSLNEYYILFLGDIEYCEFCGKEKKFISLNKGFEEFCVDCVTENNIKNFCLKLLNKFSTKKLSAIFLKNKNIKFVLQKKIPHVKNERNIIEMIYCLLNNISETPICKECDKLVKFSTFKTGYNIYCSHVCQQYSKERQQKAKNTIKKRFGVDNVSQNEEIKQKKIKTNREKLGVDWPMASKKIQSKSKKSLNITKKKINNKRKKFNEYLSLNEVKFFIIDFLKKETFKKLCKHIEFSIQLYESLFFHTKNFDKYNSTIGERVYSIINGLIDRPLCAECENTVTYDSNQKYKTFCSTKCSSNSEEIKNKTEQTCLKKYGVKNPYQSEELMQDVYKQHKYSNVSQKLFWEIYDNIPIELKKLCLFGELNKELYLYNENKHKKYFIDFNLKNVCIEFNGTYWHADKRFYNENDIIKGKLAKDVWEYDEIKHNYIKSLNYELLVIDEYDYDHNKSNIIKECIEFINKNIGN